MVAMQSFSFVDDERTADERRIEALGNAVVDLQGRLDSQQSLHRSDLIATAMLCLCVGVVAGMVVCNWW